ncbi:acyl carrier protein [Pseudomonas sichuanensis]|uniref:acyl carrier protein n=1 Tax=Pseudomonas TaxID=286 RepID=UPI00129B5903|nr:MULTISPECIES: acyl carrier protein [Pseudomonas]MDH0732169.1 acyl carrier protein [Pseudomonas sichuanensis]MDH1584902.1 acyl carrier protein [Pseudomonas sichuanensis]MDH1592876.1 acyl carrier protein [Pseudomonas sichuanensis]MDH1599845.1 acyl carrier protein [Pseudomonas sichuanensis]
MNADKVKELLKEAGVSVDVSTITDNDQSLREVYGLDSLDMFNVLLEIQAHTGREVPESDIEGLRTVNDFVAYFSK